MSWSRVSWAKWIQSTTPFCSASLKFILSSFHLCLPGFMIKFWCFIFAHACYVSCPSQPWFDHIWWSRQVMIIYKCALRFTASNVPFGSKMLSSVRLMPDKTILSHSLWKSLPMVNPHYLPYVITAAVSCIVQQCHTFHSDINCDTFCSLRCILDFYL